MEETATPTTPSAPEEAWCSQSKVRITLTNDQAIARKYVCTCGQTIGIRPAQQPDKSWQATITRHKLPDATATATATVAAPASATTTPATQPVVATSQPQVAEVVGGRVVFSQHKGASNLGFCAACGSHLTSSNASGLDGVVKHIGCAVRALAPPIPTVHVDDNPPVGADFAGAARRNATYAASTVRMNDPVWAWSSDGLELNNQETGVGWEHVVIVDNKLRIEWGDCEKTSPIEIPLGLMKMYLKINGGSRDQVDVNIDKLLALKTAALKVLKLLVDGEPLTAEVTAQLAFALFVEAK